MFDLSMQSALDIFCYVLVLIYGLALSADISTGGHVSRQQKCLLTLLCLLFLLVQGLGLVLLGERTVKQLYPLVTHVPLVLILILFMKKSVGVAIVSTCTAYLCCQPPRWGRIAVEALTQSTLAAGLVYILLIPVMYYLLRRFFVAAAYNTMTSSTAALLLFGSLPTREQLDDFCELLAEHRALPDGFMDTMNAPSPNIMNKMQRCVLGLYSYDEHAEDLTLENILNQSINLIASMPTMMVNAYQMKRRYYDKQSMFFHLPKPGQSTAEHILSTYRPDQKFTHEEAKLLDMCLLVHADHGGGNCSTFTTRVVSSSGSDTYSVIAAALSSLKGPKHGGANLMVNRQLKDILKHVENPEDDDEVREYLRRILRKQVGDGSGLIYGMGHAVYTISDPREVILKQRAKHLAYEKGFEEEYNMLCSIERLAPGIFAEEKGSTKPVCANVDLFSGLIYNMLGISEDIYTPLFAIARVPGWCAHRVEEVIFANRIIRPAYKYLGVRQKYKPIEER